MRALLVVISLWICWGTALGAEQGVKLISTARLGIEGSQLALGLSQDWTQPQPKIKRALIILHGRLRNAQTYLHSAEIAATRAGQLDTTLLIAPQFLNQDDVQRHHLPDSLLHWKGNGWMAGDEAQGPRSLSSYAALDVIVERLSDRSLFPALEEIVIAGHSGGGQVVQRYAVLGREIPKLKASGIGVRYVIANPSSYAYFDDWRPVEPVACPVFNDWKYGMLGLPAYANGQSPLALERRYVARPVIYLLGQQDTNPDHPALDRSCAAEAQGAYRLQRGHNYVDYLVRRHPQGLNQRLVEVPGVGHDGDRMFTSEQGRTALFP